MIIVDSEPPPNFLRVVSMLRKTIHRRTGVRTHGIRCMRPTLYLLHHSRLFIAFNYMVSVLQHFNYYVYAIIIASGMQRFMTAKHSVFVALHYSDIIARERSAMPFMKLLEVCTLTTIME